MTQEYTIERYGAFGMWYKEGDHMALVGSDPGMPHDLSLRSLQQLTWYPPYKDELISPEKVLEIQRRLISWAKEQGDWYETDAEC
jgi:hypothetical protein